MDAKVRQVMEFAACDAAVAESLLQQHGGNVEQAINAFIADPSLGGMTSAQGQTAFEPNRMDTWDAPPIGPLTEAASSNQGNGAGTAESSRLSPKSQRAGANDASWADTVGNGGLRRSPRNIGKGRASPVDLTADDDDEDMKKAVQASLESETDRQKQRQKYGPPRGPSQIANEEEEQLTRAIEASMLQSSGGTRPQTPSFADERLQNLGTKTLRRHDQPQAVVPPSPFMHLFASVLQAVYAATPLRTAILSMRFHDVRLEGSENRSMDSYWKGASPAGVRKLALENWRAGKVSTQHDRADALMRLSTLLVYMTLSKRPLCVAEDVITHSPVAGNFAYTLNSERKPAEQIIGCYLEYLFALITELMPDVAEGEEGVASNLDKLFSSFTTSTVQAKKQGDSDDSNPYEFTINLLQRNATNTNVHRALYSRLVDERCLYHKVGKTLFLSISHLRTTSHGLLNAWDTSRDEDAPFSIEPRLFLDRFMYSLRDGEPLDLEVHRVRETEKAIEDLERYKKTISTQNGEDSRELLRQSISYFQKNCKDDGSDPLRTASIAESLPQLEKTLQQLESEIELTNQYINKLRLRTDALRNKKLLKFEEEITKPENQTICYDICAVVRVTEDSSYVHVVHRGDERDNYTQAKWWRIADGGAHESSEEDALDPTKPPAFLVYTVHEDGSTPAGAAASGLPQSGQDDDAMDRDDKPAKTLRMDSEYDWWSKTPLAEAIERDNAEFGVSLAQGLHANATTESDQATLETSTARQSPRDEDMHP